MNFEVVSQADVRAKYARATDKRWIIGVLADLTCATEEEVAEFLGVELPHGKLNTKLAYQLYKAGKTDIEIAAALEVSRQAIYNWRMARDLPRLNAKAGEAERWEAYNRGLSDRKAALELGLTREAFREWRKRNGIKANYPKSRRATI